MLYKTCSINAVVKPSSTLTAFSQVQERRIVPIDPGMKLLRFRAIGCLEQDGPNGNWDSFPYDSFEDERPGYGYKSFVNKRAHLEHNSAIGLKGSIGDLPDAYLNRFIFPKDIAVTVGTEGPRVGWANILGRKYDSVRQGILETPNQRDGAIEVLMRIDTTLTKSSYLDREVRSALERIVRMIETGQKLSVSMGCNIEKSCCSICGNVARYSEEYCNHLQPRKKGSLFVVTANEVRDLLDKEKLRPEWLKHTLLSSYDIQEVLKGDSNKGITARSHEINHGTSYFELSIVHMPAFTRANELEKFARKQNEERREYLQRLASEFSNEDVIDLYSILQERGLISTGCEVV